MADIFLSYAREDRDKARLYAEAFESTGWTVFWDWQILPGHDYHEVLEAELDKCRCVVVLWSAASVKSRFVKNEANVGDERNILVPVSLDAAQLPLAFRHRQSAQLQEWTGDASYDAFLQLLEGMARHVPRPAPLPATVEGPRPPTQAVRPASTEMHAQPAAVAASQPSVDDAPRSAADVRQLAEAAATVRRRPPRVGSVPGFRSDAWYLPDEDDLGFIEVSAGAFTMGSDNGKTEVASVDELPQHQVTLPAFFIGRYEVTVGQFKACAKDGGCTRGEKRALEGADGLPVRYVSWPEALAYCTWLETKLKAWQGTPRALADALAGRGVRALRLTLPSEAEWERAARGTDGRVYPWGDRIDPSQANYQAAKRGGPTPVGSFPLGASPVGAMDMCGNVWEWTRSRLKAYPYRADDGREGVKTKGDGSVVVRGGAFDGGEWVVRATYRGMGSPSGRNDNLGFRVAISPFSGESA